jgi:biopolymer transport protein ExbD
MKRINQKTSGNRLDAGAMADIAFLLLIFFLVATSIMDDQGLLVRLPPYEDTPPIEEYADRNVLVVKLNGNDEMMVEGRIMPVEELCQITKDFILNPQGKTNLATDPKKAIVSLQNDRGTTYRAYIAVYNELKAAYRELWEAEARRRHGRKFEALSEAEKKSIRGSIPLVISEAEPTDYGI